MQLEAEGRTLAGRLVLPQTPKKSGSTAYDSMQYFQNVYGIRYTLQEVVVTEGSSLVGMQLDQKAVREFRSYMHSSGYRYSEETENLAYRLFAKGG